MRGAIAWAAALVAGCGSVSGHGDAGDDGDAAGDAAPAPPPGTLRWARSLSAMSPSGVVEGAGGLAVTGWITAPADLGGGVLTPVGASDTVVASFSTADATHIYSTRFGSTGQEYGFLDNEDSQGAPMLAGVSYGDCDLGLGPVTGGGGVGADGFIGRYGPGAPAWVKRAVGPGEDKLLDTALGPSTVFAIGWFEQSTLLDTSTYTSVGGRDILFARFNSFTGELQAARTYGSATRDEGSSIAAAGADVIAIGFFDGTLTLGATPPLTAVGGLDVWVAKLDASGAPMWSVRFGSATDDRDPHVAVDAAGDVYITASFTGPIAFGAVNLTPVGMTDIFVAKLRGGDGTVAWATSIGSVGGDQSQDIAVDEAGRVYVSGWVGGPIETGGDYAGGVDAVIASYESGGVPRWHRVIGTTGDDRGWALGAGTDAIYAAVVVAGAPDLGGLPIIGPANPAGLILKIQP